MVDRSFGLEVFADSKGQSKDTILHTVLRSSKKTSFLAGKEMLFQAYDMSFGIHDYVRQEIDERSIIDPARKRPLSSVAFHNAEVISGSDTLLENRIKSFADLKIYNTWGISLIDFLSLPVEYVGIILNIAKANSNIENRIQADVLNDLQRSANMPKK